MNSVERIKAAVNFQFSDRVPVAPLACLKDAARIRARWSLRLAGQMVALMDRFESAGIWAVPFKGPALAAMAYGNLALRHSEDLDFTVAQRDVRAAFSVLIDAGFRSDIDPGNARHARFVDRGDLGQYMFHAHGGKTVVELHTERTMRYFPVPLDWEYLRGRLETVVVGGRPVRTFSAEDLLALLSVHGAKHFWGRLSWICDIAELAQIPRGLDWEASERVARRSGCRRMWLLGLSLAHEVLDAPLPGRVMEWIQSDPGVADLSGQVHTMLVHADETQVGLAQRLRFRVRSHARVGVGLRQSVRVATRLTEDDWTGLYLPTWAESFYSALRPWRLLYKRGFPGRGESAADSAPGQPLPHEIVERMLRCAGLDAGDVLYDLGCGDGRAAILAAKQFGAHAVGIDIDPVRIAEARAQARRQGVERFVEFRQQDPCEADFSPATVITLSPACSAMLPLTEKLQTQLQPGARLLSCGASLPGWIPDKIEMLDSHRGGLTVFSLWRMPVNVIATASRANT